MYILVYGYNDDDGATITEEPIITEATFISVLFHGSILGAKGRKGRKGRGVKVWRRVTCYNI